MQFSPTDLQATANTIRGLAIDAVQKANSGHPGMPMGMADVATVLWSEVLRWSAREPNWLGRDRFVLSGGHGSMLLYALLHLAGYPLTRDDLKQFRQLHSKTPGHPECGETVGVETTTGPLGQGFANAVGMAIAARMESARFHNHLLETRVFVTVGDGDLMEGISSEAAALAGHLRLSNLVCLFDDNTITIEGHTDLASSEQVGARFAAHGWQVHCCDGHDMASIRAALHAATTTSEQPQLICCRTTIGKGSPNKANTHDVHGAPLGAAEVTATKLALGLPSEEFFVDARATALFGAAAKRNEALRQQWHAGMEHWERERPDLAAAWRKLRERALPSNLMTQLAEAAGSEPNATRVLSGNIVQKLAELVPNLVSGSADLDPSTKTRIKASGSFTSSNHAGRTLHYGVREHAMGAVMNGISLHGAFLPAGSTFLVFADYMRTPMRLAALMRIPAAFVFTHDSLMVGEDGPTHQPVEHLATLRLIPNLHVFRPADGKETAAAWTHAVSRRDGPVVLALTRQNLPALPHAAGWDSQEALRGGYVLVEAPHAHATMLATGAEVGLAVAAAQWLERKGVNLRVVSMPCVELFLQQDASYRARVLGSAPVFACEMGRPELWCQFTGRLDRVIGQSSFGASAPYQVLTQHFGFQPEQVGQRVLDAL